MIRYILNYNVLLNFDTDCTTSANAGMGLSEHHMTQVAFIVNILNVMFVPLKHETFSVHKLTTFMKIGLYMLEAPKTSYNWLIFECLCSFYYSLKVERK